MTAPVPWPRPPLPLYLSCAATAWLVLFLAFRGSVHSALDRRNICLVQEPYSAEYCLSTEAESPFGSPWLYLGLRQTLTHVSIFLRLELTRQGLTPDYYTDLKGHHRRRQEVYANGAGGEGGGDTHMHPRLT